MFSQNIKLKQLSNKQKQNKSGKTNNCAHDIIIGMLRLQQSRSWQELLEYEKRTRDNEHFSAILIKLQLRGKKCFVFSRRCAIKHISNI